MRKKLALLAAAGEGVVLLLLAAGLTGAQAAAPETAFLQGLTLNLQALQKATPFQSNDRMIPPRKDYKGPLFVLNHVWPSQPLPKLTDAPWQAAIHNGTISPQNAGAYAEALKAAVAKTARDLIMHYGTWNAAKAGWYNEPWLGSLREAIHGAYSAGQFGPGIFPGTGLRAKFRTTVVTYYDERAAQSLYKVWGKTATNPKISTDNFQFEEGSIIVKAAVFYSTDPKQETGWWDAMNGAEVWKLYTPVAPQEQDPQPPPQVWSGYVAQFDIIVKDSQSAPQTGWVFTTLVYDSASPGGVWDKMVPLGAEWGNDSQAGTGTAPLLENWINPQAPKYATQTLGWGGRLSGPNDGARNDIAVDGKVFNNAANSGCISCHSTAQWNAQGHKMPTFLLPSYPPKPGEQAPFLECGEDGQPQIGGSNICSPAPGSSDWAKWFQNRLGTQPMDAGSLATDFDEVFSFKSLPLWWVATGPRTQPPLTTMLMKPGNATHFNQYNGAPLLKPEP